MPELPEVELLRRFLADAAVGHAITAIELGNIAALKSFVDLDALAGFHVAEARRHGKWLALALAAAGEEVSRYLVWHLSRAGWLRWYDEVPTTTVRPGKSPIALRVRLDSGAGFDLTEAGTKKRLAIYVVDQPTDIEQIATLGPDPLDDGFSPEDLAAILRARNQQVKGVLRDQSLVAGIGNAYSDEILHAARMSPYLLTGKLTDDQVRALHGIIQTVLADAISAGGSTPAELKDAKRSGMRVHGRAGEPCPVCGDVIREVSFADSALQYCPTCQTDGKPLADRRLSRLLK